MTRLYTYRETADTGFAPNPFHGVLTLANCKPDIRRTAQVGDWVAAFTANFVKNVEDKIVYRGKSGEEKVVWIGRVTKKLTYAEYWELYPQKRPKSGKAMSAVTTNNCGANGNIQAESVGCCAKGVAKSVGCSIKSNAKQIIDTGDNIYKPDSNAILGYVQIPEANFHTDSYNQNKDLRGKFVLICEEFYYFGAANPYTPHHRPIIPPKQGHRINNAEDKMGQQFIEEFKHLTIGIQK